MRSQRRAGEAKRGAPRGAGGAPRDPDPGGLVAAALAARERAYAPYSGFRVGAAVRSSSGRVFVGQNVENASYGLSICAERSALLAMVAAGERSLRSVAVVTDAGSPTAPCGACRQFLREFARDAVVLLATKQGKRAAVTLASLLPRSFGPGDLGVAEPGARGRRRS